MMHTSANIQLGLRQNMKQFILLVIVNAFVGGMIGLERTIIPKLAEDVFDMQHHAAILSFIITFGIVKAATNYFAGYFSNTFGRKKLLIIGWLFALPVPFLLMFADSWSWVILANVFLGINQGLAWSVTIIMKMDLVDENERGLAMGLNEFAGYVAIAITAFFTGLIAANYGIQPYPFYLGFGFCFFGLFLSIFFVKETKKFSKLAGKTSAVKIKGSVFYRTSFRNRNLSSVTQAGLVNNLNDGLVWGLLPILLIRNDFNLSDTGIITASYPAAWGMVQLVTGRISDYTGRKFMITSGMLLQGVVLFLFFFATSFIHFESLAILLGIGTAMVYPTFLAAIADNTHPKERAESVGVFRLWRDLGYAIGAITSGLIADAFGIKYAILFIAGITILSGIVTWIRMKKWKRKKGRV